MSHPKCATVSTKNHIKTVPLTVGAMQTHLPNNPFDPAMTDSVLINAKIHIIFGTMRKDVYNTRTLSLCVLEGKLIGLRSEYDSQKTRLRFCRFT